MHYAAPRDEVARRGRLLDDEFPDHQQPVVAVDLVRRIKHPVPRRSAPMVPVGRPPVQIRCQGPSLSEQSPSRVSRFNQEPDMFISNTQEIPGKTIVEFFGVVSGSTVRAKHIGRDIAAGLKNVVGGELRGYTELLAEARGEAIRRMSSQAEEQGANAIVNVRFATSSVAQGAAELFAYGTAVRVE